MYGNRDHYSGGGEQRFAPVKEGEVYDVTIEAVGEKGDGIAKIKGFVIFVPNVKQGDQVKIKIGRVLRKVAFGEVVHDGGAQAAESSEGAEAEASAEEDYAEESESAEETSSEEESHEDSKEF